MTPHPDQEAALAKAEDALERALGRDVKVAVARRGLRAALAAAAVLCLPASGSPQAWQIDGSGPRDDEERLGERTELVGVAFGGELIRELVAVALGKLRAPERRLPRRSSSSSSMRTIKRTMKKTLWFWRREKSKNIKTNIM